MHKNNNANKICIDSYEKDKIQWGDILSRVVFFPELKNQNLIPKQFSKLKIDNKYHFVYQSEAKKFTQFTQLISRITDFNTDLNLNFDRAMGFTPTYVLVNKLVFLFR